MLPAALLRVIALKSPAAEYQQVNTFSASISPYLNSAPWQLVRQNRPVGLVGGCTKFFEGLGKDAE